MCSPDGHFTGQSRKDERGEKAPGGFSREFSKRIRKAKGELTKRTKSRSRAKNLRERGAGLRPARRFIGGKAGGGPLRGRMGKLNTKIARSSETNSKLGEVTKQGERDPLELDSKNRSASEKKSQKRENAESRRRNRKRVDPEGKRGSKREYVRGPVLEGRPAEGSRKRREALPSTRRRGPLSGKKNGILIGKTAPNSQPRQ